MNEWIIVNIIVLLAAALQAITGSGFAIMATPFLLIVMESRECILISIFLSFLITIIMTPQIRQHVDWTLFRRIAAGSLAGAPIGLWLFISLPLAAIKLTVAIVVLIVSAFTLWSWFFPANHAGASSFRRYRKFVEISTGMAAGLLTVSIGMPGVPLALYFAQGHIGKEQIRSTTLAFFIVIYIISIALQGLAGQIDSGTVLSTLKLIPATVAGIAVGARLFGKFKQRTFQLLINLTLVYTGLHMLFSAL